MTKESAHLQNPVSASHMFPRSIMIKAIQKISLIELVSKYLEPKKPKTTSGIFAKIKQMFKKNKKMEGQKQFLDQIQYNPP